jgi:predicted nuclease of predicted toxin-antitoxin system
VKFFLDNNLSSHLAHGMRAFGEDVIHLQDVFPENTDDPEWLEYVGDQGFFLITRDERVRRRPVELESLLKHKVGAFFLGGKNLGRCDLIRQLVANWSRIKEEAGKTRPPFAFRIPPRGTKFVKIPLT